MLMLGHPAAVLRGAQTHPHLLPLTSTPLQCPDKGNSRWRPTQSWFYPSLYPAGQQYHSRSLWSPPAASTTFQDPQIQQHGKTCKMTESPLIPAVINPFGIQLMSSPLQLSSLHQLGKQACKPVWVCTSTRQIFHHVQIEPVLLHPVQLSFKVLPTGGNFRAQLVIGRTCASHPS